MTAHPLQEAISGSRSVGGSGSQGVEAAQAARETRSIAEAPVRPVDTADKAMNREPHQMNHGTRGYSR